MELEKPNRRTVLKGIGAGVVGSAAYAGTTVAGGTGDERRQDSFTWANDVLYEMLEAEPHPLDREDEGDEEAHRPIWFVAPQDPAGHSPHFPLGKGDHVIDLDPGVQFFTAQWHLHRVENATGKLAEEGVDGAALTNADAIAAAENEGLVTISETPVVFTCPVRPHQHK